MQADQVRQNPIGIAGAGRMAQSLGRLLHDRGEAIAAVASRSLPRAQIAAEFIGAGTEPVSYSRLPARASRLLIAVSDEAIERVARSLARAGITEGMALHTSGAYGPEVLKPLSRLGISCATLHPLQTVSSPEQGLATLPSTFFAISGEGPAARWAEHIVKLLGGRLIRVRSGCNALYHATAVMASNYLVALLDAAISLMQASGIEGEPARQALAPLVRVSVENAIHSGPLKALTGPIERGDAQTVRHHLEALQRAPLPDSVCELYGAAGRHALQLARRKGLPQTKAVVLQKAFEKELTPCRKS